MSSGPTREGELGLAGRELEGFECEAAAVLWECGELEDRERASVENRRSLESELKSARERLEELDAPKRRAQTELDAAIRHESGTRRTAARGAHQQYAANQ